MYAEGGLIYNSKLQILKSCPQRMLTEKKTSSCDFGIFQVVEYDKTPFPLLTGAVPVENSMKFPKEN